MRRISNFVRGMDVKGVFVRRRLGKDVIDDAISYASVLEKTPLSRNSALHGISRELREYLSRELLPSPQTSFESAARFLEERRLNSFSQALSTDRLLSLPRNRSTISDPDNFKSELKLFQVEQYFRSLHAIAQEKDISWNMAKNLNMDRLVETNLLGSASERIAEHIQLCGPSFTEDSFTSCIYAFCEPEVQSVVHILQQYNPYKKSRKLFTKLSKFYLVDDLELNTKCRCVYVWTEEIDNPSGKPLPSQAASRLLYTRREFFPECEHIGRSFLEHVHRDENLRDASRDETMGYFWKVPLFVFTIGFLDALVCML